MKIRFFIWSFLFFAPLLIKGQDQARIIDWKGETSLRSYQLQLMHDQYDQRREELNAALISRQNLDNYRLKCREKYLQLIGGLPAKTPLNAQVTGSIRADGYSIEKVIFESRPGHHVTANLYLSDSSGKLPAVLLFCGHEMTSKATESYQKTAILFALNGFVVLVVDPISQGERVQFTDSLGVRILRGSTTEHTLLNAGATLVGTGVVAWELFDNIRALDYLCSREEVDTGRIGCLGNSGGGTQTAYFIGYDERIKVAAPCSYVASRERNFDLTGANDGCQHIVGEGAAHLEIGDFLMMFAPKPLLILAGKYDFVDYRGTLLTLMELEKAYSVYNSQDKLFLFTYDDGHGISRPKREKAVEWFCKWLKNIDLKITEPSIGVLKEEATYCTTTGQVNSSCKDEKDVQDYTLQAALDLEQSRKTFSALTLRQKRQKIMEMLSVEADDSDIEVETKKEANVDGFVLSEVILRRKEEIPLPCVSYWPAVTPGTDTVSLLLFEDGKDKIISDTVLISSLIKQGKPFLIADIRGMGETAEPAGANEWKYYNREYHNAMLGLHTGHPLPGQRVQDIFTLLKYVSLHGDSKRPVKIIATGSAVPVAMYAAILNPQITEIDASRTIRSYFEILENPMMKDGYSYVLPGVLKYFDLPDIQKMRPELVVRYK